MLWYEVIEDARTAEKWLVLLQLVSSADPATNFVVDSRGRGSNATVHIGMDFDVKASWSRLEETLWGPILKRGPQTRTTARWTE